MDPLGADLAAAFRDVAQPEPTLVGDEIGPVGRVKRVHLEARHPHEEARTEVAVAHPMVTQDVTHVLAQEALDALAKLGDAVDVVLADQPFRVRRRGERRDPFVHLVVPRDVGDEVADERKRLERIDQDRLILRQVVEPGLAHQAR